MTYLEKLLDGASVEWKPLEKVCKVIRGERVTKKDLVKDGAYPVVSGGAGYMGFLDRYNREACTITVAQYGTAGILAWQSQRFWANDVCYSILPDNSQLNNKFLYYFLATKQAYIYSRVNREAYPPSLARKVLLEIEIPLPPLAVQEQIVEILDKFTALEAELEAELEARGRQFRYYRNKLLQFGEEVERKPLGEVAELKRGVRVVRKQLEKEGQYPVYQNCLTPLGYFDKANCKAETAFVIMGGSAGKVGFSKVDFWAADDCLYFITPEYLLSRYLYYFLCKKETYLDSQVRRAAVPRLARSVLADLLIPLPPLAVQEQIVAVLDKFHTLVHSLSEGLPAEIALRQQQYKYYRRRLLDFPKP